MKKLHTLFALSALLGGLTSCSEDAKSDLASSAQEVHFDINVAQTRTVTTGKITRFVENDEIGIFGIKRGTADVLNTNVKYTLNNAQKWTTGKYITYPIDNAPVNFYACYPAGDYSTTTFDFAVQPDQSKDNGYYKSDLLMAKNETAIVEGASVSLQFAHVMAMIEVKPTVAGGVTLTSVTLPATKTVSADLVQQTATVKAGETPSVITLMKEGDVFRGVLPVQTVNNISFELKGIDAAGFKVMYKYNVTNPVTLQSNKITTFEIDCTTP